MPWREMTAESTRRYKASSKEGRTAWRKALASQQALVEEEEGSFYNPAIAD